MLYLTNSIWAKANFTQYQWASMEWTFDNGRNEPRQWASMEWTSTMGQYGMNLGNGPVWNEPRQWASMEWTSTMGQYGMNLDNGPVWNEPWQWATATPQLKGEPPLDGIYIYSEQGNRKPSWQHFNHKIFIQSFWVEKIIIPAVFS